jgi:nitroreductase
MLMDMTAATIHPALRTMRQRRSTAAVQSPAPTDAEMAQLIDVAMTVPDHGALQPWRLVVISGDGRQRFGDALAAAGREARTDLDRDTADRLRSKAFAAPAMIAVAARVNSRAKVPVWEQVASAACCGYAIALAADQLGYGAIWKSSPFQTGAQLFELLDLQADDQFLGWVNLGTTTQPAADRPAVATDAVARWITG